MGGGRIESARERLRSLGRRGPAQERPVEEPISLGDISESRRESVGRRLRALRERVPRPPARGAGGGLSAGAERVGDAWRDLPTVTRARLLAALIVAAVAAVVVFVLVPAAPCGAPGGDECPADDDAIALVPGDALAYAHLDIDAGGDQYAAAAELVARLPLLSRIAIAGVAGAVGEPVDFETQVRPWAGGELALAVLPPPPLSDRLERVVIVEVDDPEGATAFAAALTGPEASSTDVGGVEVSSGRAGTATAFVQGFLLIGEETAVAEMVESDAEGVEGTEAPSLDAASEAAVLDDLPDDRLAYGYLSAGGARALLGEGSLASLDTFVDSRATAGVGIALGVEEGVLRVDARSRIDPERAATSPPFFAALPPFEPELAADVGSDALAYLGVGDPESSIEALLTRAAADAPELLAAFNRAEENLRREGGISVTDELLSLLGSEAAISVEPVTSPTEAPAPGTLAPSGVPYVSLIADGVDAAAAARSLAALQEPLVDVLAPAGSGKVAAFETTRIAGVDAQSLLVDPNVELTYASFDDRLVIATNPLGIEQARADGEGLAAGTKFEGVTEGLAEEVSLLAYLDLRALLALGEQIGLSADPTYATYAPDLRTLDAAALAVTGGAGEIRTDLRIAVGEPESSELGGSPLGGE